MMLTLEIRLLRSSLTAALLSMLSMLLFSNGGNARLNDTHVTGFEPCDALIAADLAHAVLMPSDPLYRARVDAAWSINTRKSPWCFVLPSTADEVARTLTALNAAGGGAGDWGIAVRSGGHGPDRTSSIIEGVTVDLSQINSTTYDAKTSIASLGTGAKWQNVYDALEPEGVLVTGGRDGSVGVGGFILGGGNSWYTARTGFACDSVVNFEVVLASGEIVNANSTSNSDLWRALKGGGSNFGIVTRFDVQAFPATNLTSALRIISDDHIDEVINAVHDFTNLDRSFEANAMLTLVVHNASAGGTLFTIMEVNTENNSNTTAFDAFNRIPTLVPGTKQSTSLAQSANRGQGDDGTRGAGSYLTLLNDPQIMRFCLDQHASLVTDLGSIVGPDNFTTVLEFQPLTSVVAEIGVQKGGNVLGLDRDPHNRLFFVIGCTLQASVDDILYSQAYQRVNAMVQNIVKFAKSLERSEEFVYMNYAHANQDPIESYGISNVDFMKQVAGKYDPEGFFQRRVPGGFKVSRVD